MLRGCCRSRGPWAEERRGRGVGEEEGEMKRRVEERRRGVVG